MSWCALIGWEGVQEKNRVLCDRFNQTIGDLKKPRFLNDRSHGKRADRVASPERGKKGIMTLNCTPPGTKADEKRFERKIECKKGEGRQHPASAGKKKKIIQVLLGTRRSWAGKKCPRDVSGVSWTGGAENRRSSPRESERNGRGFLGTLFFPLFGKWLMQRLGLQNGFKIP